MNILSMFRIISAIEGISYLFLVFIAMPMKYLLGDINILRFSGMIHGVLFILFIITLYYLYNKKYDYSKGLKKDLFIYSLSPFGFILIETKLKSQYLTSLKNL